jgi:hypothetical protein
VYVTDHADQFPGSSPNLIDYVLPHFTGIFLTSTGALCGDISGVRPAS